MRYPGEEEDKDVGDSTNPGLENGILETPVPHHGRYLLRARDVLGGGPAPVSVTLMWRSEAAVQGTGHVSLDTWTVEELSRLA